MAKPRSVCFTLNNYTDLDITHIQNGSFKYIIFQKEVGLNGTPHLQGYAQQPEPTSFSKWKSLLSVSGTSAHVEAAKGSSESNIAYCTKESTRVPGEVVFELGARPKQGERKDLEAICNAARDVTIPLSEIIAIDTPNFLRYYKGVQAIRAILAPVRTFPTEVFWFYGGTGTGKTRRASELGGSSAYWKQNSAWWCGYDSCSMPTVIIDEYRCNFSTFAHLLQLFDRYSLQVQTKGGNVQFCARRIIVTSPKSPSETWATRTAEDLQQLLRRITVVAEFFCGGIVRYTKGNDLNLVDLSPVVHVEPVGIVVAPEAELNASQGSDFTRTVRARVESGGSFLADEPPLSQSSFLNDFDNVNYDWDCELGNEGFVSFFNSI